MAQLTRDPVKVHVSNLPHAIPPRLLLEVLRDSGMAATAVKRFHKGSAGVGVRRSTALVTLESEADVEALIVDRGRKNTAIAMSVCTCGNRQLRTAMPDMFVAACTYQCFA